MLASLAAALLLAQPQTPPLPPVETAFMAALAAGDARAVETMLAEDVTIMHEESGRPEPSTGAAIAAFLNGCQGSVQLEVPGDEPGHMAYTLGWSCGARGRADMLLWVRNGRVVWVQLFKLEPEAPDAAN